MSESPEALNAAPADAEPRSRAPHRITRRAVASWVLYDMANTIFSMGVVSVYFGFWVKGQVGEDRASFTVAIITAISMALIFVVSPLLGAMTDRARRRMPFLIGSTLICVTFTVLLARGGFWLTSIFFIAANIAFQAGLQFYDAMLPEVTTEENRGRIGGIGIGVGYLGSYLALGIGFLVGRENETLLFTLIGVAFLTFAIPCFLFVRERGNPHPRPIGLRMVIDSTRETIRTLASSQEYPGLLRFLIGRMFYTDSINTVIAIMAIYAANVATSTGLTTEQGERQAEFIMLSAITFAVVGGFVWGWLTDRYGPKRTLDFVLRSWVGVFALAAVLGIAGLPVWVLYVVGAFAGFSLGGVWAADRPFMLRLTPPDRIGEFYGLYGMVGRFSAITGPLIWAGITGLTIQVFGLETAVGEGVAVVGLLILLITGYVILRPVTDTPREWVEKDR